MGRRPQNPQKDPRALQKALDDLGLDYSSVARALRRRPIDLSAFFGGYLRSTVLGHQLERFIEQYRATMTTT